MIPEYEGLTDPPKEVYHVVTSHSLSIFVSEVNKCLNQHGFDLYGETVVAVDQGRTMFCQALIKTED